MMRAENVSWTADGGGVRIVDQTLLPGELVMRDLYTLAEMDEAIRSLRVRGAPAIGIFAAYSLAALLSARTGDSPEAFRERCREYTRVLNDSRPTAVNLSWALARMNRCADRHEGESPGEIAAALRAEAGAIRREDQDMCRRISEAGLSLLRDGDGILTHCNAGPLATSEYGTALGPILLGTERGMVFHVYADETRPLLQGARLTAWELHEAGADVTLICDNMAASVMAQGWIQACLVGCDRVAANGDTANKIGTSGAAILAYHYGIPFYVLGPTSTLDLSCPSGAQIPIELRDPAEIRSLHYEKPMAPEGVRCYNPAFDVTDHTLITAIITEEGICRPPYTESLAEAVRAAGGKRRNGI